MNPGAVNAISKVLYENRYTVMGMAILNGIGIAKGAALGMFYCAIAAITVVSLATVFTAVVAADSVVSIVVAIRSVMDGDYLNALTYGSLAVIEVTEAFLMLKMSGCVSIRGKNGIKSMEIGPDFVPNGKTVQEGVNPNSLKPTKDLSTLDDLRMYNAVKYGGDKPIIVDKEGNVLDGHHRLKHAILTDRAVDVLIGY